MLVNVRDSSSRSLGSPCGFRRLLGSAAFSSPSHAWRRWRLVRCSPSPAGRSSKALRRSFKRQYLLTIGVDRTQKIVEKELLKILKTSPVRHSDERTALTNPYDKYDNSTSARFLSREVRKLVMLAARSRKSNLCFTLTLGGHQFVLSQAAHHGIGAPGTRIGDASYAEICRRHWSEVKYIESAIGYYARSGRTWISYDTEKTIGAKVRLAMRNHPELCVMLVQVDKDDIHGICSEKHFPLAQSVKHAMRLFHRKPPTHDT
ncbi:hypothetical protein V5799_022627 [Amblyomma americanum]|uniref:Uncharacterized protein n=1 Tax=Amblyomma americanum TaxID=6943 RepID=A0AAQ4FJZ0_AMBAM